MGAPLSGQAIRYIFQGVPPRKDAASILRARRTVLQITRFFQPDNPVTLS